MEERTHRLKDGRELRLREAEPDDAAAILQRVRESGAESDFLSYGPGEFEIEEPEERAILRDYRAAEDKLFLVALLAGEVVATLHFTAGKRPRLRHIGELGMAVSKACWGLGIGSSLLTYLVDWARATPHVTKLVLRVRPDNERAIRLYEKHGFVHEATLRHEVWLDGAYHDHLRMGLLLAGKEPV